VTESTPLRTTRIDVIAVAALITGALALWALARALTPVTGPAADVVDPCAPPYSRVIEVWGDGARAHVRRAFVAADPQRGPAVAEVVLRRLDERGMAWLRAHRDACQRGETGELRPGDVLWRQQCLDLRMEELRALITLLRGADAVLVARAPALTEGLAPLAECADARAMLLREPLPPEVLAPEKLALRRERALAVRIAELRLRVAAGRSGDLASEARELAGRAREFGWSWLEAQALVIVGELEGRAGDLAAAERTLVDAGLRAGAAGDAETAALAAITLAELLVDAPGRAAEAERWVAHAHAWLGRLGPRPLVEARVRLVAARVLAALGRVEAAEAEVRVALSTIEGTVGAGALLADASEAHAGLLERLGRAPEAAEARARAASMRPGPVGGTGTAPDPQ
jgi:hypothetical protein